MQPAAKIAIILSAAGALHAELFVSSHDSSQVYRFYETTFAYIDTFIPNTTPRLNAPHGLAFGPDGNLYVASAGNDRVLRYHGQTGAYIDDFIPQNDGSLDYPVALIFRGPNLFVTSQLNDRVLRYNAATGAFIDIFVAPSANLIGPSDMQFGPDGNLYVTGRFNHRVCRYHGQTGAFLDTFINNNLSQPFGLRFLPSGNLLVTSGNENSIKSFDPSGTYVGAPINTGALNLPIGFLLGIDEIIVASYNNDKLARFNLNTGAYLADITAPALNGPNFMTFRPSPPPTLAIAKLGEQIRLAWPENPFPNFRLSESPTVIFQDNLPFSTSALENGTNLISVSSTNRQRFFRLYKPY